ncbi:MAG: winged helix-turn-helix transcriptional regulator [Ignavibacteriae bacterium]|nr:winged helix-turn-helix transcriptional regulator [Ignavibacteriota bacterium]
MKKSISNKILFELHAEVCKTLSHPKRLEILAILREEERNVSEIVSKMNITKSNVSQHLAVMRKAGILETHRDGLNIFYRISNLKVMTAYDLMCEVLFEHYQQKNTTITEAKKERTHHVK